MFERCPDAQLVADLIAAQAWPEADSADAAAVELIDQAMAWERVAARGSVGRESLTRDRPSAIACAA